MTMMMQIGNEGWARGPPVRPFLSSEGFGWPCHHWGMHMHPKLCTMWTHRACEQCTVHV